MFLEEIIYNNCKKVLENKFKELELSEFQMMDAISSIMNEIDLIFKNIKKEDINNRQGVIYINGYTLREWINHINETFYKFKLQGSMIYSISNYCLDDIKEISGRKRIKDIYLIFLKLKEDKKIQLMNLSNEEVVKHFSL